MARKKCAACTRDPGKCSHCKGTGKVSSGFGQTLTCSQCKGSGVCHVCKGSGEVEV
jgi:DnaJ-class molecular chaperone